MAALTAMTHLIGSLALLLLVASSTAAAASIPRSVFVAANGDDGAVGDATHPWRSLARLANLTLTPGDTIYLHAGDTWREPLVLVGSAPKRLPQAAAASPPPSPVRILSTAALAGTGATAVVPRPTIRLDGSRTANDDSQWAVHTSGIAWLTIEGLAIEQSTSGISVTVDPKTHGASNGSYYGGGVVEVADCVFRGVWNRSSDGQLDHIGKSKCDVAVTPCIVAGNVASVTVRGCLFDDFGAR